MIKNNYHTHLIFCNHAVGYAEDYVKKAIELGFDELGITDHAPIPEHFMSKEEYTSFLCEENMKLDTVTTYLLDVKNSTVMHQNEIKVLCGFESEYLPWGLTHYKELRRVADYMNLGVHFFAVDDHVYDTYTQLDYKTLPYYTKACIEGMETGLFNTLVHPDLYMYDYKDKNGNRNFDENCERAARQIIEAAIKNNIYLEVNANGLKYSPKGGKDGYLTWCYPYYRFWEIAKEYKSLKIIIGSDAHSPEALGNENVESVCKFAKDLGLRICERMEINH